MRLPSSVSKNKQNKNYLLPATYHFLVTCYTMQNSCFHRAISRRAEESRRKPKKAEESRLKPKKKRNEPSQQKGGIFILRCSATVGYTHYAISTTTETVFGGVRSEELSWKSSAIQSVFRKQFYERVFKKQLYESFLSSSLKKLIRGVSSRREFRSVKM
jgi:hypothetical protein